uniref:Putative ixodes 26 kDa salivary protein n=1 Tax=Ixodes ricinus TaxID=34613 RepID=A0A0K8R7G3_IXORI
MIALFGALTFILFAGCFGIENKFDKYYLNRDSGVKTITIAFALAGFQQKDATFHSNVGQWIDDAKDQAQLELSKKLGVQITLEYTNIFVAPEAISTEISDRVRDGQVHAETILQFVKETYRNSLKPDVLCVITRSKFYDGPLSNLIGFSMYTTLCEEMVPILLTFNSDIEDDVPETAKRLSDLVFSSLNDEKWESTSTQSDYFNGCNIRHRLKGDEDRDPDTYYVLPLNEDQYYG